MLALKVRFLLACIVLAIGGCSTPCGAPGRLCAPAASNTSAALPARPAPAPPPPAAAETFKVDTPDVAPIGAMPKAPLRIGLLLPTRSEGLGKAAAAVRDGFMAAHERDRDGITVAVIDTGDSVKETVEAYAAAVPLYDVLVGPLARSAVSAVAASPLALKPTIALNHPDPGAGRETVLPPRMLVMGLSIEDEARQVAAWASIEHPGGSALILSCNVPWQRRIAQAFAATWRQLGLKAEVVEMYASDGYIAEPALQQLPQRIEADQPALVFAALDADQVRQVRGTIGTGVPVYGTSSVNPGRAPGSMVPELDGLRLLDLPWQIQSDHPAVMVYPRQLATRPSADMNRLYALGIDAFRVAREIALRPDTDFKLDGVTGKLTVDFGDGAARFERQQPAAVYRAGHYTLVAVPR